MTFSWDDTQSRLLRGVGGWFPRDTQIHGTWQHFQRLLLDKKKGKNWSMYWCMYWRIIHKNMIRMRGKPKMWWVYEWGELKEFFVASFLRSTERRTSRSRSKSEYYERPWKLRDHWSVKHRLIRLKQEKISIDEINSLICLLVRNSGKNMKKFPAIFLCHYTRQEVNVPTTFP